ncbi:MAG: S41 family peptidase [Lachnospiraceae bacterium]|nr:S41 family peptidase [Lachnospiraceae bacterium]
MTFLPEDEEIRAKEDLPEDEETGENEDHPEDTAEQMPADMPPEDVAEQMTADIPPEDAAEQMPADIPPEDAAEQPLITETDMKKHGRRRFISGMLSGAILALLCMTAVVFVPGIVRDLTGKGNPGAKVLTTSSTLTKLAQVQEIIEDYYLDEVDGELLESYLFKGIAAGLDDAYASYYTAEELSSVMDSTRGEYYGIGASIGTDSETGEFYIGEVYEDSPAKEGGLKVDDIVRAVDGETIEDLTLNELVTLIKSKDTFTMTVYRPDTEEELELTITCGDVTPTYVTYEMLDDNIGYLKLTEFTESAVEQFRNAVEELNEQGMEKLIVDVRDNPGGLLSAVCDILDEILPEGLIVYTEDKNGNREEYNADDERSVTCEVAVLVNGSSASASEIFAGAIQDYGIGPIIGTQTYGKGVVQKTYSLSDGSAFKLTVENYYTPNGQEIDGNGITPDIVVDEDAEAADAEVAGAENTDAENADTENADAGNADTEDADADSEEESDPVLARAIEELSEE